MSDETTQPDLDGIAIIGMAGRFPGASNLRQFWHNLRDGVESITWLDDDEIEVPLGLAADERLKFVNATAILDDVEHFDAAFFGFNPREAEIMDPQHRLFLESAWEALEDAGYDPTTYEGSIGVFASTQMSSYLLTNLLPNRPLVETMGALALRIANDRDFLPTRVSYKLNLRGPSVTVVTACSSSLVATHLACQSLLDYQSDMVLVGGVTVNVPQKSGYTYQEGGLFSPDGHCRAFDANAQGTFGGSGLGIVVLKRLEDAIDDGDQIYAVIRGSATNNDGAQKVGYTAPSVDGQAGVILAAQIVADVDPTTISYIEGHGAGTPLGDPIEVAALTQAFRVNTDATGFCALGSVKTNVGHLDSAAGVAGLIKTVLALKHRQLPPSLNCEQPNPAIDFPSTPFYVNTHLKDWEVDGMPRRAGVSSFGVGGTNVHVILEEAPEIEPSDPARHWQLLPLSARTATALQRASERLLDYLREQPDANLADVAYTLQKGRRAFDQRQIVVCRDTADAIAVLEGRDSTRLVRQVSATYSAPIAFMFAGLGDHYVDMGLELYQSEAVFRETIDRCAALLKPELRLDLRDVLYPRGTHAQPILPDTTSGAAGQAFDVSRLLGREPSTSTTGAAPLNRTDLAQPILFVLEYALAQQWIAWGVQPQALIGHSLGEYVAATLAGVFTLPDALRVVSARARLIQSLPAGAMLTVMLSEQELQPYLSPELALAAVNSPLVCVVAGSHAAIDELERRLYDDGVGTRRLSTSHAFHSHLMEPILDRFIGVLRGVRLHAPEIPIVSNVTGGWLTAEEATDPRYWARHLRQTVRFADGARLLWSEPGRILIEVGPGQSLSSMARQQPKQRKTDQRLALPTLRSATDPTPDRAIMISTIGKLWLAGAPIDWGVLYRDERRLRVALPTYPFERQRYWIDPPSAEQLRMSPGAQAQTSTPDNWCSVPVWREALLPEMRPSTLADQRSAWLIVADPDSNWSGLSQAVIELLLSAGQTVDTARPAAAAAWLDPKQAPGAILYFWDAQPETWDRALDNLHAFVRRLAERVPSNPARLAIVATQLHDILGETQIEPADATLSGLCAAINAADPALEALTIDVGTLAPHARGVQRQTRMLIGELLQPFTTAAIAYRSGKRWFQSYAPAALNEPGADDRGLRQGGTYVVTGNLDQIGATFVEQLIERWSAQVVLIVSPDRPNTGDEARRIESQAALVLHADPHHLEQMQAALALAAQRFGALDGWFYGAQPVADSGQNQIDHAAWRATLAELNVIAQLCDTETISRVVVCAPLAARLGEQGLSAALSSAVLEAFVQQQRESPAVWISLAWDTADAAEQIAAVARILEHGAISQVLIAPPGRHDRSTATNDTTPPTGIANIHARPDLPDSYVAPRNATEQQIVAIWEELLGIAPIGMDDNFFELGGHSLLATRLLGRLRELLGIELPLNSLFVAPTVGKLAEQLALTVESTSEHEPIPAAPRDRPLPLSFSQQRLWLLQQIDAQDVSYNMPFAVRVSGPLDAAVLTRCVQTIVDRHETLRTTFTQNSADLDGQPQQRISPTQPLTLAEHDLTGLPASAQTEMLQQLIVESARQPFDLQSGPLLRIGVARLSLTEHVVYLVMHHIISDGWSIGVFIRELISLYDVLRADQSVSLPPLPLHYADYAVWQRGWLRDALLAQQLDYWTQQLAGAPPVLALPTDRPRPPIRRAYGQKYPLALDTELTTNLKLLSQREGVTLFMTLLAAFNTLLYRWSGQPDLVVGAPIAGRSRPELEPLIGFFVNTLALRTDLSGNPAFVDLLRRVRDTTLGAYAHQDLPFERLVEELRLERDLSYTPLIQVVCTLQNTPFTELKSTDLTFTAVEFDQGVAQFDLMLALTEQQDRLQGVIEYNTDLFDATTIERLAGQFQTLLAGIVAAPEQPIGVLPLLPTAERQRLLSDWNRSAADYPRDAAVHRLIEAQAERSPESTAIVFEGASLSYGELNARANQLAHHLRAQGVGPDVLVALMVERSLEMIVGMLAILKAGGAYVPLDPAYPAERLHYMLSHSRAPVILTHAALVEKLPEHTAQVFCLDADWHTLAAQPTTNLPRVVWPDNLAYIIYTSGSTGRPKGVMVTQQGLINLVYGLQAYFDDPAVRTVGLITSISFDISVNQIFPTLIFGRTLHIIPDPVKLNSRALVRYLDAHQIHLLDAVPSYLQAVLNEVAPEQPANALCYLLIGGEKLEPRLLQAVFGQLGPQVAIINIYGLTEISDINILGPIRAADLDRPITAGKPLQNNRIYILDRHDQPQPIGIAGEICISGESVSRGYLQRPELTAERFVACPFEDGQIMVRTGDLGRWHANGTVEILGRIDHQVKIRGFRIETGEIEAVLAAHPQVSECVVVAREDRTGDKRLVAYVVEEQGNKGTKEQSSTESSPSPAAAGEGVAQPGVRARGEGLRAFLQNQLPDYMIPSAFVLLDALPKTPSGKLDRKALPAPDLEQLSQTAAFVAPRTPTEELLAGIWTQLLDLPQVSIHANFFELGGHSLLATRIVSRLRETFAIELPLRTLFEAPTLAMLATQTDRAQRERAGSDWARALPPLTAQPRPAEVPLSFAQQRLWLLDRIAPDSAGYNIAAAVRLDGPLDEAALSASFTALIARHEVLRTTFVPTHSGQGRQVIGRPEAHQLTVVDLQPHDAATREAEVQAWARVQAAQPFDLSHGPLLRTALLRLQPDRHVLLLTMHHIIADGWSIGVLIGELAAHYSAILSRATAPLPPLPLHYADYAVWQRDWLRDELLAEQLRYWRQQFEPLPPVLALPTDRQRPPIQTYHGALREFQISLPLLDALKQLGHRQGATLFMTLLAAFQVLLQRWSGQPDLVVGAPIAGRTHAELEPLIGFFVNTLALRADLSGNPAFVDLLRRVRDTTLGAYAHQDLPFELLLDALALERDLSHHPLFQVMFVLQNTPLPTLQLDDLRLEPVAFDPGIAKFDLTLNLSETTAGLIGSFEYNTDLFDAATIERLAEQFQLLLAGIVAAPEQPIGVLPLLPPAERRLLLDWNRTTTAPAAECLSERFAAQAVRTPEAIAVIYGNDALSYAELDRRANQLAQHLRTLGVGGEICVGICAEPSLEVLIGLLGILKAGGAYVPLDPALPAERLQFMLHDSRSRVLLTQQHLLATLPTYHGQTICLDRDWPEIARQPTTQPTTHVAPEQLAYIIYTSGSTGVPKGVMISQRGLASYLGWAVEVYRVAEGAGAPVHSSLGFDLTVTSLFTPLLCGRTVQLVPQAAHVEALASALSAAPAFSLVKATPAHLDLLRHMLDAHTLPEQARALVIGGEALRYDSLAFWRTHAPETRLINEYGPTEAVVGCCIYEVTPSDPYDGMVPIGRPTAGTQIYILDAYGQPAPIGVVGEIHLGGVQLARGYLNRPDLTAERFIPDPFTDHPGARLYRTGDLGRYRPDGTLEYLGRIDRQIKLRGYRVELGEIEAVLVQHPDVREAAVVAHGERGETRLVAYIVGEQKNKEQRNKEQENLKPRAQNLVLSTDTPLLLPQPGALWAKGLGDEGLPSTLRQYLQDRLPSYMMPNAFVQLDALPLTPNGKLDQRALPAPSTARPELSSAFVAPRTPTEHTLAAIWQDVLGRDQVGILDNFFALGGDSIRSIAVVTAAQAAGLTLTVQQLFQHQTIAALAPHTHAGRQEALPAPEPFSLIRPADRERLPAGVEDAYPLTQLQLGMLFHSQYHPEASVYHNIASYQLHGPYEPEVFAQVAQEVVDRHAALRTAFEMSGYAEPLQLVYRDVPVQVLTADLRSLDAAAQEATLDAWIEQERGRVFRWDEPPLARFYLHQRASERFQFSFSFHHAILDGWSVALLLTELFQRYMARLQGTPIAVEPLQTSFRSFVALEQAARESIEQQAFWADVLRDRPALSLPLAATPQSYAGPQQIVLAPELAAALRRLAADLGVPLRSVLLTAHLAVLRLISGERRVLTGLVTNGRPETPDGERLLGLFLNSVPFRITIDRQSWRELIRATFAAEQQMLPFRRYPLAQMQRDFEGQPLFEVLFNFVHFHAYQQLQQVPGLQAIDQRSFARTNFALDVTFSVGVDSQAIGLELDYDVRLSVAQAERLVGFYLAVLTTIVAQPDHSYSAAALLAPSEHDQLLTGNQTALAVPDEMSIQHFFEAQAARTPEATALIVGTERLTYQALNQRANQLAHALRERGIGPEMRVGVCLERSADLVVALLAVLKAGGAYVPLDPAYPQERLAFMLADAQASLLLTQSSLIERVPAHDAAVLCLDTDWKSIASQPTRNPPRTSTALNLAYLIYTSGSTGRPKGVAITQRNAAVLLAWAQQVYTREQLAGVLASTSVCFDLSMFELFVPLSRGGTVILAATALDLPTLPAAQSVTLVNTVPSAATELLRVDGLPASVQTVNLAGEALPQSLAHDLYARGTVTQVINLYGPSEDTTYSTWALIPQPVTEAPTIGRPIANTQAYVLDATMQPVPLGVAGELYLGGDGLARGYLNRPDLTAERFVPDPFSMQPGARLYRTGDRALLRVDGQLAFLGRTDNQVKLRGFRIELGEIETALRQHPAIRDAAVLVREDTAGTKRLVAYVVENKEQTNKEQTNGDSEDCSLFFVLCSALREFLADRLPDYMLPGAFVELDALPLTINGKLDRQALPEPEYQRDAALVGPRDMIELRLVQLWEELLDTRPIGVRDSFFALSGDSLLAVRLMAQIQRSFAQQLPLAALFQARTIEQLGGLLRQAAPFESDVLVPIQPHGTRPPLFLVHPIGGNVLTYVELAHHLGSDQPLYGLQARGLSDPQHASGTIAAMAADYIAALRTIQPHGPYRLGGWSFGGVVAVEMAQQLQAQGEPIAALILIDSGVPTATAAAPDDLALLAGFARDLGVTIDSPVELAERFATEDERFGALLEQAQRSGIVPPDLEQSTLQQLFAIFRTNLLALQGYTPQPYAGPITLFVAAEEPTGPADPRLAWAALVDGMSVHEIPADHYTILKAPAVQLLAAELRRDLEPDLEADPVRESASCIPSPEAITTSREDL